MTILVGYQAVSRGEALRDMEVMPINHNVWNQPDQGAVWPVVRTVAFWFGGKPKTVKTGDFQPRRHKVVIYIIPNLKGVGPGAVCFVKFLR